MQDPDPAHRAFASNLRRLRLQQDLTQEELGRRAGLDLRHVRRLEQAEREPGVVTVARLARGLGLRAADLFEGREFDGRKP